MQHLYLRFSGTASLAFALLVSLVSALGAARSIHPMLRGFIEGCAGVPQPCWYGVVPGMTTVQQGNDLALAHGYVLREERHLPFGGGSARRLYESPPQCPFVLVSSPGEIIYEVFVQTQACASPVAFGDLIAAVDFPEGFMAGGVRIDASAVLSFEQSAIQAAVNNWVSLRAPVTIVFLFPRADVYARNWHGMLPMWRYCLFEDFDVPAFMCQRNTR
jgi:hypothetical protein